MLRYAAALVASTTLVNGAASSVTAQPQTPVLASLAGGGVDASAYAASPNPGGGANLSEAVAPKAPETAAVATPDVQAENQRLRSEIARLQGQLAALRGDLNQEQAEVVKEEAEVVQEEAEVVDLEASEGENSSAATTTAKPTVLVNGLVLKEEQFDGIVLVVAAITMAVLWGIPFMRPCRACCETRLYKVFPMITAVNFLIFGAALSRSHLVSFNDFFFISVKIIELMINEVEQVLIGVAGLAVMGVLWKFKDRILEMLGVENAKHVVGEFRDWATCWSMRRFHPMELFIWKVEGLPSAKLHTQNDVYCEISLGYNVNLRTRVHHKAGHGCVFKESVQLNFDPFDNDARLNITVRNQDIISSGDIASVQLGVGQVQRLEEGYTPSAYLGHGTQTQQEVASPWAPARFRPIDLIPCGRIYLRFSPVYHDEEPGICQFLSCCCPRRIAGGSVFSEYSRPQTYNDDGSQLLEP